MQPILSVAVTVRLNGPNRYGAPLKLPPEESETPGTPPALTLKLTAPLPPLAFTLWLYAVPAVPLGSMAGLTVMVGHVTLNIRVTGGAAAKLPLPAWLAVIEQLPTATSTAFDPLMVQIEVVLLVYATVKPELAVAPSATEPPLNAVFGGALKVIVCAVIDACLMLMAAASKTSAVDVQPMVTLAAPGRVDVLYDPKPGYVATPPATRSKTPEFAMSV